MSSLTWLLRIFLIVILWTDRCTAIKWLALYQSKQKPWTNAKNCSKSVGLNSEQIKFCRQHLDLMGTLSLASYKGIDACQKQFYDRRWNCSSIRKVPRLSKDLKRGTREQAFVYATGSAALTHSVARACSLGITTRCNCGGLPNEPPQGDFKWGGCGDDVEFGLRFSESFLIDSGGKKTNKKELMNGHNYEAGRTVVARSLTTACKCHGVSGSCSIKTCWRALPDFDAIAMALKDKYHVAVEVKRKRKKGVKRFVPINKNRDEILQDELMYFTKSPDYCSPEPKSGSVGTSGRSCDPDSDGPGGCDIMCCGRGFTSNDVEIVERCECKYVWCCYVRCKTCSKTLRVHRCK